MKKWLPILFLLFGTIALSACNESKTKEDLSSYPESVQNGTVSNTFYDQYISFKDMNNEFSKKASESLADYSTKTESKFVEVIKGHDKYLEDIIFSPTTEADTEIYEVLKAVIDGQKFLNTTLFLYTSFDDEHIVDAFGETLEDALQNNQQDKDKLESILSKYGIN